MTTITDITEKDIGEVIMGLSDAFDEELLNKTESELEEHWFFKYDPAVSVAINLYHFHDLLKLYGSFCRRWEEAKNGSCCVVERVRDKYLMPKILVFAKQITSRCSGAEKTAR